MPKTLDHLLSLLTDKERMRSFVMSDPSLPDNPIIFANNAFCALTNYPRSEFIGRNCRFLQGEKTDRREVARIRSALSAAQKCEAVILNYRADGVEFWNHLLIRPLFDNVGKVENFVGVQQMMSGPEARKRLLTRSAPPRLEQLLRQHPDVIQEEAGTQTMIGFNKSLRLLAVWQRLKERNKAHRAEIDPIEIGADILPHIVLLDAIDHAEDYKWRLFGSAHIAEYGVNLTGVKLSDLEADNSSLEEVELIFRYCQHTGEPTFYRIEYENARGVRRTCCGTMLPLFDTVNVTVTHLLGCSEWMN